MQNRNYLARDGDNFADVPSILVVDRHNKAELLFLRNYTQETTQQKRLQ
ncbi:MAG: hypothetical protein KME29_37870 [Calothrix sp. FI2-JRJ7]|nr:hypothetical protein [Calothrix sp. FI2-JRJ7]